MNSRRLALFRTLCLTALISGGLGTEVLAEPAKPGQTVNWPTVTLLDGKSWSASNAKGKAVVVVFWSTTCPFCQRHNVHVAKLQAQSVGLPLEIITVARERDVAEVKRYMAKNGYRFPVTLDTAPMAAALSERRVIPLTVTVGKDGRLLQAMPGEMFEEDVLELAQLAR